MQVTVERPMLFLGKQRTAGEVVDSKDEPALLGLSTSVQRALEEANYISTAERKGAASASEQHLMARIDQLVERQEKFEVLAGNLESSLKRIETLLGGECQPPSGKGKKG